MTSAQAVYEIYKQNYKPFGTGETDEYSQRFKKGRFLGTYLAH
jgi:hypothetical protein